MNFGACRECGAGGDAAGAVRGGGPAGAGAAGFKPGTIPLLTQGGLRGGISMALALSWRGSEVKPLLPAAICAVVVLTIVLQRSHPGDGGAARAPCVQDCSAPP